MGLFDNATAKRVMPIRWEMHLWQSGLNRGRDNAWFTSDVLGYEVASRRLVWHALERTAGEYVVGHYGPYINFFKSQVGSVLWWSFHYMNSRLARDTAARIGARWSRLDDLELGAGPNAGRLFVFGTHPQFDVGAWVCPRKDGGKWRELDRCIGSEALPNGSFAAIDLPSGPYTIVASPFDSGDTVDIDLQPGAEAGVTLRKAFLFNGISMDAMEAGDVVRLRSKSRLALYPSSERLRDLTSKLTWPEP